MDKINKALLPSAKEIQERINQYQEAIAPLIKQKVHIINMLPNKIILTKDGDLVSFEPIHTEATGKMIKNIDEAIEYYKHSFLVDEGIIKGDG